MPLPHPDRPLTSVTAREAVYEQLRDWITLGPLEPGELLRDTEIASHLDVSRTPVREALLRLSQEGLVELRPGRSTRVAPLRFERAGHLFTVGGVLDALAAEQAIPNLEQHELDEMSEILELMRAGGGPYAPQVLDERFHAVYYRAARNPPLSEMLEGVTLELRRFDRVGFRTPQILREALNEHDEILAALQAGDVARATSACRFNWTHPWDQIAPILEQAVGEGAEVLDLRPAHEPGDEQ